MGIQLNKVITKSALAAIAIAAATPALAAVTPGTTVTFETPTIPMDPDYNPTDFDSVTFTGKARAGVTSSNGPFHYANDGSSQIATLQNNGPNDADRGVISIALTGLDAGLNYYATFDTAFRASYGISSIDVSFLGTDSSNNQRVVNLGTITPATTTFASVYTAKNFTGFVSGILSFTSDGGLTNDNNAGLDNITLRSAVPEAGTWAMMLIGFGAVGVGMRRRKTKLNYAVA